MRILPPRQMPPSRQERRCSTDNPSMLTPAELAADEALGLENFKRYSEQSVAGRLPSRKPLTTFAILDRFTPRKTNRSQPQ